MIKTATQTDVQLNLCPYYAESVRHYDENFEFFQDAYYVSNRDHALFALECDNFDSAQKLAKVLNDLHVMYHPKGK